MENQQLTGIRKELTKAFEEGDEEHRHYCLGFIDGYKKGKNEMG